MSRNFLIHLSDVFDITQGNSPMHHTGAALTFSSLSLLHEAAWRAEETTRHNQTNTYKSIKDAFKSAPQWALFLCLRTGLRQRCDNAGAILGHSSPLSPWLLHPASGSATQRQRALLTACTNCRHLLHGMDSCFPRLGPGRVC